MTTTPVREVSHATIPTRRELLADEMRQYQEEFGEFTDRELTAARHRLHGTAPTSDDAA